MKQDQVEETQSEEEEEGSSEEDDEEEDESSKKNKDTLPPLVGTTRSSSPTTKSSRKNSNIDSSAPMNSSRRLTTPLLNLNEYTPPKYFEFWIRCMDINQSVYYYNNKTGESTWLAPCAICYKTSDKYCVDCKVSYCDLHFYLKHKDINSNISEKSTTSSNNNAIINKAHQWMAKELPQQEVLKPHEVYCIECNLKRATKMCTECWDAYCNKCFETGITITTNKNLSIQSTLTIIHTQYTMSER